MSTYAPTSQIVISDGNSKIGKIPNVSLPPVLSCAKDVPCAKEGCYSMKSWKAWPSVKAARLHNWEVWLTNPEKYFKDISDYLTKYNTPYFRFHVDGDIPDTTYFQRMTRLADEHPNTRFLAFTKRYTLPIEQRPCNLSIIPSAWPGFKIPEFKRTAWMEDGRENRYGARFDCKGHCDKCYACWHIYEIGKDVVFTKH